MPAPAAPVTPQRFLRRSVAWALGLTLAMTVVSLHSSPASSVDRLSTAAAAARPNIMVIMLDDMRADELRFAPNTRRYIRDRGLEFRNSFSPFPLCCPARASFLTGKYAHNHRILYHDAPYGFGAFDDSRTLAGKLRTAGYDTALVGKYLNRYGIQKSKVTGKSSIRYVPAGWTDWMVGLDTNWPAGSPNWGNTYDYFNFTQNINGNVVPHRGRYSSTVIADQVRGLIGKYHQRGKPFFLWVTPVAPHHGGPAESDDPAPLRNANGALQRWLTPARPNWVKGRFDAAIPRALGVRRSGPSEANVDDKPRNVRRLPEMRTAEKLAVREIERQRAESIYAWDVEFGRIVDRLKATGEYARTVFLFTSDNGYFNGEHRHRSGKIKAYEPVLRVPLVVAGPGISRGVRYNPITTMDLTATVLDLADAPVLPAMDGASQLPSMTGADPGWTTAVVTEGLIKGLDRTSDSGVPAGFTTSGIRTGRFKLIRYSTGEGELYDLKVDPLELSSKWRVAAYRPIRTQLLNLWEQYRRCQATGCRVPLPVGFRTTPAWLADQFGTTRQAQRDYYG